MTAMAREQTTAESPRSVSQRYWADAQESMSRPLYEAVLEVLQVAPGTRLLDAGCGTGLAVHVATARGATVAGVDISEEALARAREQNSNADLRVADLGALPFADASFDAVVGFNSYQFARDSVRALHEAARVTRPGREVAIAAWGPPDRCDSAATLKAVRSLLPTTGSGNPFALSASGTIEALMKRAGIRLIASGEVNCPWEYPGDDAAWWALSLSSPGAIVRAIHEIGEERVRQVALGSLQPFKQRSGGYRQENVFRYVVGQV